MVVFVEHEIEGDDGTRTVAQPYSRYEGEVQALVD